MPAELSALENGPAAIPRLHGEKDAISSSPHATASPSTLLIFQKPLGFVAILGILALLGMIARNAVILIDQIESERAQGKAIWESAGRKIKVRTVATNKPPMIA
jgi:Cu/Ag efflux pump CusA